VAVEKVKITVEIDTEYGTLTAESEVDGLVLSMSVSPRGILLDTFNAMLAKVEQEVNAKEGVGG